MILLIYILFVGLSCFNATYSTRSNSRNYNRKEQNESSPLHPIEEMSSLDENKVNNGISFHMIRTAICNFFSYIWKYSICNSENFNPRAGMVWEMG